MKKEVPVRVTVILLAIAAGCCIFGIMSGEAHTGFVKAANICLECIGLG